MKLNKVDVKTLRQQVYDQLCDNIMSGTILPGQTISLRNLADQFGVSLMPVREALWQLESEKLVIIESNKSIRVNKLTAKEMEEALRIRILLESEAAKRSCERYPPSALPKIERILSLMQATITRPHKNLKLNYQFHSALYFYAESPLLLEMIHRLWARTRPYFFIYVTKTEDISRTIKYHEELLEAFVARDENRLLEALRQDIENPALSIIRQLKKLEDE